MNMNSNFVLIAENLARTAHQGQFRRDGTMPYITHPQKVAERVSGDDFAEAAAWLHDVLEDTTTTIEDLHAAGIPEEVTEVVSLLTKKEGVEYEQYLAAIAVHPIARRVKIADMITNLSDDPSDKQIVKYAKGLLVLMQ